MMSQTCCLTAMALSCKQGISTLTRSHAVVAAVTGSGGARRCGGRRADCGKAKFVKCAFMLFSGFSFSICGTEGGEGKGRKQTPWRKCICEPGLRARFRNWDCVRGCKNQHPKSDVHGEYCSPRADADMLGTKVRQSWPQAAGGAERG